MTCYLSFIAHFDANGNYMLGIVLLRRMDEMRVWVPIFFWGLSEFSKIQTAPGMSPRRILRGAV